MDGNKQNTARCVVKEKMPKFKTAAERVKWREAEISKWATMPKKKIIKPLKGQTRITDYYDPGPKRALLAPKMKVVKKLCGQSKIPEFFATKTKGGKM